MTAPTLQPIEIFKPGRHQASSGSVISFTESHLSQAARVYSPELHRAPLVVGHPKTDDVAYGHVASLAFNEATARLVAEPADVEPAFAELVADGRLLAVSASFYPPGHAANPVPDSYYLRHVGFLGAEAPAVKGLKRPSVAFAEHEDGVVEFSNWTVGTTAGLFRGLRDWLIGQFGQEQADKALPAWSVQSLADDAVRAANPDPTPANGLSYSERNDVTTPTKEELDAQAAQIKKDREALDQRQAAIDAQERTAAHAARTAEFREFLGGLVKDGCRVLPVQAEALVAVMAQLPEATVVEFAEAPGSDKLVSKPAVQVLKEFLQALPKNVDFSERARDDKTAAAIDFSNPQAINQAAQKYITEQAAQGVEVSLPAAVTHVMKAAEA